MGTDRHTSMAVANFPPDFTKTEIELLHEFSTGWTERGLQLYEEAEGIRPLSELYAALAEFCAAQGEQARACENYERAAELLEPESETDDDEACDSVHWMSPWVGSLR